jgi:hypothetical protein
MGWVVLLLLFHVPGLTLLLLCVLGLTLLLLLLLWLQVKARDGGLVGRQ